jgi:hypothetical protein
MPKLITCLSLQLYTSISSRPGQSGHADDYILDGKELEVSVLTKIELR